MYIIELNKFQADLQKARTIRSKDTFFEPGKDFWKTCPVDYYTMLACPRYRGYIQNKKDDNGR